MAHHHFPWHDAFLAALHDKPVLSHAARVVGVSRVTAWRAMEADPAFKAAVEAAMEEGIDKAEQEAFRRAVDGWEEPLVHQGYITYKIKLNAHGSYERDADGKVIYERDENGQPIPVTIRKYSDALLAKVLGARRKAYGTQRTEITGADGAPVRVDSTTRAARLSHLMTLAKQRKQLEGQDPEDFA